MVCFNLWPRLSPTGVASFASMEDMAGEAVSDVVAPTNSEGAALVSDKVAFVVVEGGTSLTEPISDTKVQVDELSSFTKSLFLEDSTVAEVDKEIHGTRQVFEALYSTSFAKHFSQLELLSDFVRLLQDYDPMLEDSAKRLADG